MADIDQIIAGGAGASSRGDFSGIADLPEAYWKGKDRRYTQEGRDLFKGGVPTNPDGTIDYGAMRNALFQHGDVGQGVSLENVDLARQQLKLGQSAVDMANRYETGQPSAPVLPPSANRTASTAAAPPLNRGGIDQQPAQGAPSSSPSGGAPTGGGTSVMQILAAQGIPNDQLGAASASAARQLGIEDPTQPIDINDPRIRDVLGGFIRQIKTAGVGNIIPPGQPAPDQALQPPGAVPVPQPRPQGAPGPQPIAQAAPPQPAPQPPPQAQPQGQPGPVTNAATGTTAPSIPSRIDQGIALYSSMAMNAGLPQATREAAKARLLFLEKQNETTPEQKNYIQAKLQGFPGTMQEYQAATAADKAYAEKNVESYIKKYDAIQTAGDRARTDLPKLDLAVQLTKDPKFYSGVGENYNLLLKRAIVALGGDENAATPQEGFRKVVSDTILDQIKAMAGTGPVRVAEMKIIEAAAANPGNTPQANRLVLELASRMQKRAATLADMAQNYNNGRLDSGFERKVAAYDRANPLISDKEIPDFRKIIGGPAQGASPAPAAQPKFSSPSDVHAAISAGKLKSGDPFTDGNGKTRYVP